MKTTKRKNKAAAKGNRTVPARQYRNKALAQRKSTVLAHDAMADILPNGDAWTISVEAGDTAYIADNVSLYAIIQNRGPGIIGVPMRNDARRKIVPGGLYAMPVVGAFFVENVASASAVVQIQFLPKFK